MNSYQTSNGKRVSKATIDRKVKEAKQDKWIECLDMPFCEDCGTNQGPIDMSHTISVKEAQESSRSELAWDVRNIKLRCRGCHMAHDNKTKEQRESIYWDGLHYD